MTVGVQTAWADNVFRIGETEYSDLSNLITNGLSSLDEGQTVYILTDYTWPARGTGTTEIPKSTTFKPASGTSITITIGGTGGGCQVYGTAGTTLTFDGSEEGASLTFDANGTTHSVFENTNTSGGFVLKSVTLKNMGDGAANEAFVTMKSGLLTLNNVTFSDNGNAYNVLLGRSGNSTLTLIGANTFSSGTKANINFNADKTITINASEATNLSSSSPISIDIVSTCSNTFTITGGTAVANFSISDNYFGELSSSNVLLKKKVVYNATSSKWYNDFATAVSSASASDELQLYADFSLSARTECSKTITIKPYSGKEITVTRKYTGAWFTLSADGITVTIDGSNGGGSLTFDGNSTSYNGALFEASRNNSTVSAFIIKNITIKNATTTNDGLLKQRYWSTMELENIAFEDCTCGTTGFIRSQNGSGGQQCAVTLKGDISFTNCTGGPQIYIASGTYYIDAENLNKPSTPFTVAFDGEITSGKNCFNKGTASYFRLTSSYPGYYLAKDGDMVKAYKVSKQTYTLTVTSALMSTLVLPFSVTTLPEGITAYKLTTTNSVVSAQSVPSIAANEPVLIVATAAGNYTFTNNAEADASYSSPYTGYTNGALIGTYYSIDAADDNYVLQGTNISDAGFYKLAASSNHVINPFRAYLSGAENDAARLSIVFEDNETTGISSLTPSPSPKGEGSYYNLNGQHVSQPTKGLYIQNGKKIIMK